MKSPSQTPLSSSSNIIFSITMLIIFHNTAGRATRMPENETVPALIVFGDSIVDPGNNNDINTLIKCNFQPYGRDFKGGQPTGRFSNGRVPSDFLGSV